MQHDTPLPAAAAPPVQIPSGLTTFAMNGQEWQMPALQVLDQIQQDIAERAKAGDSSYDYLRNVGALAKEHGGPDLNLDQCQWLHHYLVEIDLKKNQQHKERCDGLQKSLGFTAS